MKISLWRLLPFTVFLLLAVFFWRGLSLEPHHLPSVQIGKKLPDFKLPSLQHQNEFFTPHAMTGQYKLLNFFASWCNTCSEEQIFLLRLAREGIPVYGVNYKDNPIDAERWLLTWGNPYQEIGLDRTGKMAIDLGVYGTPETFLIDKTGVILARHVGALNQEAWEKEFLPHINKHTV